MNDFYHGHHGQFLGVPIGWWWLIGILLLIVIIWLGMRVINRGNGSEES